MKNLQISQDNANALLKAAAELVVVLRSKGYHLTDTLLDADRGSPVKGKTAFQTLQDIIKKIRWQDEYPPSAYDAVKGGIF